MCWYGTECGRIIDGYALSQTGSMLDNDLKRSYHAGFRDLELSNETSVMLLLHVGYKSWLNQSVFRSVTSIDMVVHRYRTIR